MIHVTRSNILFGVTTNDCKHIAFFQVLSEALTLPKSFDCVLGMGPGGALEADVLTYLRSNGCSERDQVVLMLENLMEDFEQRHREYLLQLAAAKIKTKEQNERRAARKSTRTEIKAPMI